jgi:hypothetical protein
MRKFLGTWALVLIVIACIGVHRDWFSLSRVREGSETEVHLQIHRDRIRNDTKGAAEAAREIGENLERKLNDNETFLQHE